MEINCTTCLFEARYATKEEPCNRCCYGQERRRWVPKNHRQFANLCIVEMLKKMIEEQPDLRFGQILMATKAVTQTPFFVSENRRKDEKIYWQDEFYLESVQLLQRMTKNDQGSGSN